MLIVRPLPAFLHKTKIKKRVIAALIEKHKFVIEEHTKAKNRKQEYEITTDKRTRIGGEDEGKRERGR